MPGAAVNQTEIEQITRLANQKLAGGDARGAMLLTRQVMQTGQANVPLLEIHSQAALGVGDLDSAISSIEKVIQAAGATVNRAMYYGDLLLRKQRWHAAADVFQQVIRQQDGNALAWLGLAHCLLGTGDVSRAAQCYSGVLDRDPGNVDASLKLANCLLYLGDAQKASVLMEKVYEARPESAEAGYYYGESLRQSTRVESAIRVFQIHSEDGEWGEKIQRALIMALLSTEQFDEAASLLSKWLVKYPDDVELLSFKARLLSIEGQSEQARLVLEALLVKDSSGVGVWEPYVELIKEPLPDDMLQRLYRHRALVEQQHQKRLLAGTYFAAYGHFALSGDMEKEIEELNQGNALMADLAPFDWKRHGENVKRVRESYPASVISQLSSAKEGFQPTYILCTPRSGSTLLEQALARHSAFWAGGEKNFAGDAWNEVAGSYVLSANPEDHEAITAEQVSQFAERYLEAAREAGWQEGMRMVHKGINCHKFAGLLKAAFPRARFLELRRNPMDVAFGCYRQNFESQPFSYTVEGCAAEIALYQQNMRWWHKQMPESIHRVTYEGLVEDFEGQVHGLLEWLGLEWEDACQDFSRKSRVSTASVNQVRQGLFTKGVGRWKKYGDLLTPLQQALEEQGVAWN